MSVGSGSPHLQSCQKSRIGEELRNKLDTLQTATTYDHDRYRPFTDRESTVSLSPETQFLGPKEWDKPGIPIKDIKWIRHAIPRAPGAQQDDEEPGSPEWGPLVPIKFHTPRESPDRDGRPVRRKVAPGKLITNWHELDRLIAEREIVKNSGPMSPSHSIHAIHNGPVSATTHPDFADYPVLPYPPKWIRPGMAEWLRDGHYIRLMLPNGFILRDWREYDEWYAAGKPAFWPQFDPPKKMNRLLFGEPVSGSTLFGKPRPLRRSKRIAERLRRLEEAVEQASAPGQSSFSADGLTRPGPKTQRNKPGPRGQKKVAKASRLKGNKDLVSTAPTKARQPCRNVRESRASKISAPQTQRVLRKRNK